MSEVQAKVGIVMGSDSDADVMLEALMCRGCGGAPHKLSADLRAHLANAMGADWLKWLDAPWSSDDLSSGRNVVRAFIEHRLERAVDP